MAGQDRQNLARCHEIGNPAHKWVILTGRVIVKAHSLGGLADQRVIFQRGEQLLTIGQLAHLAAGVGQDDFIEFLLGVRVTDQASKGDDSGAGRKHPKPFSRQQRIIDQSPRWFLAHEHSVSNLDLLQVFRQWPIRHFD